MQNLIEVCTTSVQSCIHAQLGGALRVELCDNLIEGGTTPGPGTIKLAREKLNIDLFVMIRPRGGDFCYSEIEFEIMKADVKAAVEMGADGVVAGILLPDGRIDVDRMKILRELAGEAGFTCHRAFDMTVDKFRALDKLIEIGVDRILTSGGKNKAPEGAILIREVIAEADGRIAIMPGSGVNEDTIIDLRNKTGATEFHVTGRSLYPGMMKFRNPEISMGDNKEIPEYEQWMTDPERIKKIVELANS
jgi:copper homeostasis protein